MARPRSTVYVVIGTAAFIVAAALVFLVLRSNDKGSSSSSSTTTTSSTVKAGPSQGGTTSATPGAAVVTALPIPEGKQAVAVKVAFVAAGAGFVHQGDSVNLYGTFKDQKVAGLEPPLAKLVLSNVQVLSVTGVAGADTVYLLAVDAEQAERVIYLTTYQSIYLTLVPKNGPPVSTGGRNAANIL
jgi:Flp pilus assembly protein CpaB